MATRRFKSFSFSNLSKIKQQVLNWSAGFDTCSFLDNQQFDSPENSYECLAAAGEIARLKSTAGDALNKLKQFSLLQNDWLFGHFSFDLKSETEGVLSSLPDHIGFPDLFFFVPKVIVEIRGGQIHIGIHGNNHDEIFDQIVDFHSTTESHDTAVSDIRQRITKQQYITAVELLQQHILRGDCYEVNFCQEFFIENITITPVALFQSLIRESPSPFSAFYKTEHRYLFCASPERYLKKTGKAVMSQPIKGTSPRDHTSKHRDESLKAGLSASEKDKTENVMIVDLVRNDLSRICEPDSVFVSELFGIYSFAQVHQMISTIRGTPKNGMHWSEMIGLTFPMGSMTGAPKKKVLELIELYESTSRGLFSGALGYVKPDGDFDFNVVIRSLLYNANTNFLSYFAGSGITVNSEPDKEYEECLMKVRAMETILKNPG